YPSCGMSAIMNGIITRKWAYQNILTGITRKKPTKVICGTDSCHPRQHRKRVNCWIKPGNLFMP
ncbi:hypothetical protein, partial [Blautia wexlerae]|uniref:hypothetical protein n=1 Tax=Blautia wexlerae TaxID=418240 RepID=UPI00232C3E0F